ncbi:MAG TPA: hypothetical protein VJB12_04235 [Candidatus Nanoarchaeia archaeon]|nr:hypothetical protein [Candidatus Nanoarchaeia archaeon]
MEKSGHLSDEIRQRIVSEELERFMRLVKGHENLLLAIGKL